MSKMYYVVSDQGEPQRICGSFEDAKSYGYDYISEFDDTGEHTSNAWERYPNSSEYHKILILTIYPEDSCKLSK